MGLLKSLRLRPLGGSPKFLRQIEAPIRAELFSVERLEQHAASLAAAQSTVSGKGRPLVARVRDNGRVLLDAYRAVVEAIDDDRAIVPAAEWLVDNFHVVEEQIRTIQADLPRGFYRQLPKLEAGPLAGYPRVFGLAWAFVAHSDSLFEPEPLRRFIDAYQRVDALTIGELWAVAITLRIVLVENVRRAAERIVIDREACAEADLVADRLLGAGNREPEVAATVLRRFEQAPLSAAFAVQLVQRLRDQDPAVTPALQWLDERLAVQGTTADEIVRSEHQSQGAMNVTVRNAITSMRLLSAFDWVEFFESVSLVDATLRAGSDFAEMDFATRDRYRNAIEELARWARKPELAIARLTLEATRRAAGGAGDDGKLPPRERDPGFHLIANGRRAFERELRCRVPLSRRLRRVEPRRGIVVYCGVIAALGAVILSLALLAAAQHGAPSSTLWLLALLAVIPATDAAVALGNHGITRWFGPDPLPGLALRQGVPRELRTIVVVPTLLTTHAALDEQLERLEVHHLASPDGDLRYALLSDWIDSASESAPGDEELLAAAVSGMEALNRRHGPAPDGERFLLLHRRRVWNAGEEMWMGWERKRGKLHELNRLLRGADDTSFVTVGGRPPCVPDGVRYVITLDADTRLPREAAQRLVGKIAHPLNRARFDARSGRVVEGYAVLQPRVTPSLPIGREGSIFQRVFSGPGGIDPYAAAVSDVYQDLFGEGSYSGKGIYEVDTFEAALAGWIPENTLLSHDLLEGIFARAGLVSDLEVVEEFPSRYDVAAVRQHRWARGDWQLLPWIFGRRRAMSGDRIRTTIPWLGRLKMFDNLRRTLSAPALFGTLCGAFLLPSIPAGLIGLWVLGTIALPSLLPLPAGIVPRRRGISKRSHLRSLVADSVLALAQIFFRVAFLAHQAWLMGDAIVRTLVRLFVTRRRMLEWVTAAQAARGERLDLGGFYRRMAGGVALAVSVVILIGSIAPDSLALAAPWLALWLAAPALALWSSRPPLISGPRVVSAADAAVLRQVARRTWRFFETFVTPEDHALAPDNFQEDPNPVLATRTSPTNLGLYLLSVIAARDFGWIGTCEAVDRIGATLETMEGLERFRGHFYNWYDTRDLHPLDPKYISSVDSGNLAGHLIALASALRQRVGQPGVDPGWRAGVGDALVLMREALHSVADDLGTETVSRKQLEEALDALALSLEAPAGTSAATPAGVLARLAALAKHADTVIDIAKTLSAEHDAAADLLACARAIRATIQSHERDLDTLMPWVRFLSGDAALAAKLEPLRDASPSLADLPDWCELALTGLAGQDGPDGLPDALEHSARAARALERRLSLLAEHATSLFAAMDFRFLYDPARQLLSLGYRVADDALDPSCYDLLASEARLASFLAIAKGDVPVKHWFRLGRALTPVDRGSALISWSGSMFEYLMPSLVMRVPVGSLLDRTSRLIVRRQIEYGAELDVPWGVSESAYNARDLEFTYQYSNFGVPGLGLQRGLSEDVVIAPYATGLAAMVDPAAAARNFTRLAAVGGTGRYGWYEALDYTATRRPVGEPVAIVRAYMAHHQGMTLVAIANALHDGAMRARFHADPLIQASELLLQERTPRDIAVSRPRAEEVRAAPQVRELGLPLRRHFKTPHGATPRTHLLSNGDYAVMVTTAGSGFSRWRDLAVTRWREDVTCDAWGSYVFLRDVHSGRVWSAGHQPSGVEADEYEVSFCEDRVEFVRRDGTILTTLEVAVSPEDDAEVRRVSIANLGARTREIELTSYSEVVLAPAASDTSHPAFSKLFVQTEFVAGVGALLATRRPRSPDEVRVWAAHLAVVEGEAVGGVQFETDRARFLGRGRTIRTPMSVLDARPLSDTVGTVLDPIFSLRRRVRVPPGGTARIAFWTMVAPSRSDALDLADKHRDATAFERAATLSWTQAQVQLHHLGIEPDEALLFQRLANHVLYSDPKLRPSSEVQKRGEGGPSALWPHGISGDLPIVLVRIDEAADVEIVRQLMRAHEYWRMKRLAVDLVILNERPPSYSSDLQSALESVLRVHPQHDGEPARGSVFVLRAERVPIEVRNLLQTVARAVLLSRRGSLAEQVRRLDAAPPTPARRAPSAPPDRPWASAVPRPELEFFNGLGGFAAEGREYVTFLGEGQWTPAPWLNVVANPCFGFQVSAEGAGFTWSQNSRENQLTPWSNDPIGDAPGEVLFVRDEDDGATFGPTALPIREESEPYVARYGQGYTRFEHRSHGLSLELLQYVPLEDPIKISRLSIVNHSGRRRRLSVTAYVEWVLAATRGASAPFVVTEMDAETGALFARNPWRTEFAQRVAFVDLAGRQTSWTGDRSEFVGRNGTLDHPAAFMDGAPLSNRVGAGLDPCGALQTRLELGPSERVEVVFFLGETASKEDARALIARYRNADLERVLGTVTRHWDELLGTVQVKTPDRSMDILLNRWLLYQTLVCRVWARSGFYQASGAYGFRDQLQDGMALVVGRRQEVREHLLRAAARQFREGDVQHWWLPSSGLGVRTRISDDRVWLPYTVAHYLDVTEDRAVLDEGIPFLEGPALHENEAEAFFQPMIAEEEGSLFEHCARALDTSLGVGARGLPRIGTGDWNDGMNRVGEGGQGESVWLGWFLHATLMAFAPLAERRGEVDRAARWRTHAANLVQALEREAWDGDWYRRAWFDDGTPLGSADSEECRIDSIAQSWAVLSGAADPARSASAMAAVEEHLVRRGDGLIVLFTPPFDRSPVDPGYIKGYPPGIRENGGQYTHAALWSVLAFAMLGDGDKVGELFSILNPINCASTRAATHRYKVEPFVACADVYSEPPHVGRGGWTWYTGSAGWMHRVGLERILGFRLRGTELLLDPCIPRAWPGFEIQFRYHSASYDIDVENPRGVSRGVIHLELDGKTLPAGTGSILLADDGAAHRVRVVLGPG